MARLTKKIPVKSKIDVSTTNLISPKKIADLTPAKPKNRIIKTHRPPQLITAFKGDVTDVIKNMRNGVSADLVPAMAEKFGLSQEKFFEQLRLPRSTMKERIGKNKVLSASEQDRIYRATKIWECASRILEDDNAARTWISRENRSLGGVAPLSLLDTEPGYELVLDTLGRIEYGVIS